MKFQKLRGRLVVATAFAALTTPVVMPAALYAEPSDAAQPSQEEVSLEDQFQNPPNSARPRVWWHWMNGNISQDGIAKDLAWMKSVGIGGLQNFDANLSTPQIVDKRLVYMTPEWKDAFKFAVTEADRLGLEVAIAASPGWSETGGPWVPPEDGLKKLVWSETSAVGGQPVGKLLAPPAIIGPYQGALAPLSIAEMMTSTDHAPTPKASYYADVKVLAYPSQLDPLSNAVPSYELNGQPIDGSLLTNPDLNDFIPVSTGEGGVPAQLVISYDDPQTVQSLAIYMPGAAAMFLGSRFAPELEASINGDDWVKITDLHLATVPSTSSFEPVTAQYFRVTFHSASFGINGMGAASEGVDPGPYGAMRDGVVAPGKLGDLRLSGLAKVDQFEAKAGFEIVPDYYALSADVPEANGIAPSEVIDLTDKMQHDGTLDWTPPAGNWRIIRLGYSLLGTTNHPAPPEATGLEVDKFDGAAVRRYMEHYLGMYQATTGANLMGKRGLQAVLTDSIEVGAANWTPLMIEKFTQLRGYDPTPWIPALTGTIIGSRAQTDKFLYDYRRTLADLMASEHYGTVADVAHEYGLIVYGEALENGRPSLGDDMSMRSHADIPMSAMWTHHREEGPNPAHVADIRGAASVAHIYGRPYVAAESMTSAMQPWDHGPNYLKRIIDLEFVNGVNRPVIHTSVHQPSDEHVPGLTLFIFGQYFNRNDAWAPLARPWVDYMSRNSLMLQQGVNVADVAYFYGEEAPLASLYKPAAPTDAPTRYAYDYINADALLGAVFNDGADVVTSGGARYKVIYLGGTTNKMTLPMLRRLAELARGGATIVGMPPEASPALADDERAYGKLVKSLWRGGKGGKYGKGRIIASNDIEGSLAKIGVAPDVRFEGASAGAKIPFVHRKLADGDSYFLVNQLDRTENVDVYFRVNGKVPQLWNAETGEATSVSYVISGGETKVPLTLNADDSIHVVFREDTSVNELKVPLKILEMASSLNNDWDVSFQAGRGAPAELQMKELKPLNEHAVDGVKYFSGIATYSRSFETPQGWKRGEPLWLDLGEAREVAEVSVNGQVAGNVWRAPYRVNISEFAKEGTNELNIRVGNLWVNRLIGDAQEGAKPITWTPIPAYRPDAKLRPSGLIGPVELMVEAGQ